MAFPLAFLGRLTAIPCRSAALLRHKATWRTFLRRTGYLVRSIAACARYANRRHAVPRCIYRFYRSLPTHGPDQYVDEPLMPVVLHDQASTADSARPAASGATSDAPQAGK